MLSFSWLKAAKNKALGSRTRLRTIDRLTNGVNLSLERLEDRLAPATYSWNGPGTALVVQLTTNESVTIANPSSVTVTFTLSGSGADIWTPTGTSASGGGDGTATITFVAAGDLSNSISIDNSLVTNGTNNITFASGTISTGNLSVTTAAGGTAAGNIVDSALALQTTGVGDITLTADGTITQSGSASASAQSITATATGSITVNALSGAAVNLTSTTASVDSAGSQAIEASATLTVDAATGITLNTDANDLTATNGTAGDIAITQLASPAQTLTITGSGVVNDAATGTIGITNLGASIAIDTGVNVDTTSNGAIDLAALDFQIGGDINSGTGRTILANSAPGTSIDLGTNTTGEIGLTNAELANVTAGTLQIGSTTAGGIKVSTAISAPTGWNTLTLSNNSTITEAAAGSLTVSNLSVNSTGPVTLTSANDVGSLAASTTNANSFNDGTSLLTVDVVDGITGISTSNSNITLTADSLAIQQAINAGTGTVTLEPFTTGRDIDLGTNPSSGKLGIAQADLNNITAGVLQIGDTVNTGAITVSAPITDVNTGWNTLDVVASGSIGEAGLGTITGTNLTTSSATGTTLGNSNAVANFNATNTTSGDVDLTNTASPLTITGITETGGGSVNIANTGDLQGSGNVTVAGAGNLTLSASGGTSVVVLNGDSFTSGSGTISVSAAGTLEDAGQVSTTGNVNFTSTGANVTEAGAGTVTGALLTTHSATGTTLSGSPPFFLNDVTSFNTTNTTSGPVTLANTAATLTVTGITQSGTAAGSDVNVTNTGNLTTSGQITTTGAANGGINLTATSGVLTVDAAVSSGGNGAVTLANTGAGNNLTVNAPLISFLGGNLNVTSPGTIAGTGSFATTGVLTLTTTGASSTLVITATGANAGALSHNGGAALGFSNLTGFTYNGTSGTDTLTIKNPAAGLFAPTSGITFNGNGGFDTLMDLGGQATSGTDTPIGSNANGFNGTLQHVGPVTQTINYNGLSPIVDTVAEPTFTISGSGNPETIGVVNGQVVGTVQTDRITSNTFEQVDFGNKTDVIFNGTGTDTYTVNYTLPATGLANLTLNGSGLGNTFNVQATAAPSTVNSGAGADNITVLSAGLGAALTVNGQAPTTPPGDVLTFDAGGNFVNQNAPGTLQAGNGPIVTYTGIETLNIINEPPQITSGKQTTATVGTSGFFTVTATGGPTPSLTEKGALPSGVTFVDNGNGTATLGGKPNPTAGGVYNLTITAHNGVGADAVQNFTLTVNEAAAISSANAATFTVGGNGTFTATATGYPAPTFSETGALPANVTLSPAGLLSGVPAPGTQGTYPITIIAHNGVGSDATQPFTLIVNPAATGVGVAPTITSGNGATFVVGVGGTFTATATGSPTPTFTEAGALPGNVTLSSAGLLSGIPVAGTQGTYSITLTAHNGVGSDATQTFTLTVLTRNQRFVEALYQDNLSRTGDLSNPMDAGYWVALLNNGTVTQAQVAADVVHSLEAQDKLVKGWYQTYLGRPALNNEELSWVTLLQQGQSEEQVLSQFLSAPGQEFFNHAQSLISTGTPDQRYVQALYQLLLNRAATDTELAAAVNSLALNGNQQALVFGILTTTEYRTDLFTSYYRLLLNRSSAPTAGEVQFWVNDGSIAAATIGFESSLEYFTNG